jgi:nucleotide-binding universal stress UspA family protein
MANAADLGAVRTVVVGTDGSDPAAEAVAWALEEARRRGLPLHVIAAWSASRDPQETQWLATMKSVSELRGALTDEVAVAVRSVVERGGHHEVPISTRVVYADPAKALIDASDDERLLVVGSRGRGALTGLILGSVSQACAQYSRGPVVVVRGSAPTDGIGRVVVGVDGSAESLLALQFAAAAARLRGAPLEVVHVWQDTDHAAHGRLLPLGASAKAQADREWQNILRSTLVVASGVEIISSHVPGYAQSVLLKASEGAALLVVGSRGRGGWAGLLLGSVSLRCVTLSACPVAVVRAPATAQGLRDADG